MGEIFGLYSTRDGLVRCVGQTEYTAGKSLDLIVTKALDRESGALFEWIRDEWRADHEVRAYLLQDDIVPGELEMFEHYWAEQFSDLLNTTLPSASPSVTTATGRRVNAAILRLLKGKRTPGEGG